MTGKRLLFYFHFLQNVVPHLRGVQLKHQIFKGCICFSQSLHLWPGTASSNSFIQFLCQTPCIMWPKKKNNITGKDHKLRQNAAKSSLHGQRSRSFGVIFLTSVCFRLSCSHKCLQRLTPATQCPHRDTAVFIINVKASLVNTRINTSESIRSHIKENLSQHQTLRLINWKR